CSATAYRHLHTALCYYATTPFSHPSLIFFFLLIRPPPTSPLFPYTTLFRSRMSDSGSITVVPTVPTTTPAAALAIRAASASGIPDRKSTRLNSSHVKISYAVFCLKKKKKKKQI